MSDDKRDRTKDLIAGAEALRGDADGKKKAPSTRQLVRDAEKLIGRQPQGVSTLLKLAIAGAVFALMLGAAFLFLG